MYIPPSPRDIYPIERHLSTLLVLVRRGWTLWATIVSKAVKRAFTSPLYYLPVENALFTSARGHSKSTSPPYTLAVTVLMRTSTSP